MRTSPPPDGQMAPSSKWRIPRTKTRLVGGANRESGTFALEGASIVNGAQTVGTILQAADPASPGQVFVKIISLANGPADFGKRITEAANTQNRIERRDFAALDPNQQRLAVDVSLHMQKRYVYNSGEVPPAEGDGCTIAFL